MADTGRVPNGKSGPRPRRKKSGQKSRKIVASAYVLMKKGDRYLPRGLGFLSGIVLTIGGLLGILPILGFWMIPLGLALASNDIPPLKKWLIEKLNHYRVSRKKS